MKKFEIRARTVPVYLVIEESEQKPSQKSPIEKLREWIGLITAAAGLFSVLLYLTGRYYAGGYFSAMNIPDYMVTFSLWEYGEVGWVPLLLYTIVTVMVSSFIAGVVSKILDWMSPWLRRFWEWLKQEIKVKFPETKLETTFWFRIARNSFTLLAFTGTLIFTMGFALWFGSVMGRYHVLQGTAQVELVSKDTLALDTLNELAPVSNLGGIKVYQGLYLLTSNNGKYYLFKELNPLTCKPYKVYIVEVNPNIQVNLMHPVSLSSQCKLK